LQQQNVSNLIIEASGDTKINVNRLFTHLVGLKNKLIGFSYIIGGSMAVIMYFLSEEFPKNISKDLLDRIVRDSTDIDIYIKDKIILNLIGSRKRIPPLENKNQGKVKEINTINFGKIDLNYLSDQVFDEIPYITLNIKGHEFNVIRPDILLSKYKKYQENIFNENKKQRSNNKIKILQEMIKKLGEKKKNITNNNNNNNNN